MKFCFHIVRDIFYIQKKLALLTVNRPTYEYESLTEHDGCGHAVILCLNGWLHSIGFDSPISDSAKFGEALRQVGSLRLSMRSIELQYTAISCRKTLCQIRVTIEETAKKLRQATTLATKSIKFNAVVQVNY